MSFRKQTPNPREDTPKFKNQYLPIPEHFALPPKPKSVKGKIKIKLHNKEKERNYHRYDIVPICGVDSSLHSLLRIMVLVVVFCILGGIGFVVRWGIIIIIISVKNAWWWYEWMDMQLRVILVSLWSFLKGYWKNVPCFSLLLLA